MLELRARVALDVGVSSCRLYVAGDVDDVDSCRLYVAGDVDDVDSLAGCTSLAMLMT